MSRDDPWGLGGARRVRRYGCKCLGCWSLAALGLAWPGPHDDLLPPIWGPSTNTPRRASQRPVWPGQARPVGPAGVCICPDGTRWCALHGPKFAREAAQADER